MSFWDKFESKEPGIEDTIEFTIRMAVVTLALVILVVVGAMVVGLFVDDSVVDSNKVFDIIGPAFNTIVGAFVGLLGGLSLNANARDDKPADPAPVGPEPLTGGSIGPDMSEETVVAQPVQAAPLATQEEPIVADDQHDDDDMAPWEKYRNDLRYDANGDGVVDENDFPDWRKNL